MSDKIKSMINALINGNTDVASLDAHAFITSAVQQRVGLSEATKSDLPAWYKSGAIVKLNPKTNPNRSAKELKVKLELSVNKKSGYSSCEPIEDGVFYPSFGGATFDHFIPVQGENAPADFNHPTDEKGIEKMWDAIFTQMYSASVSGLMIDGVTVKPNGDYTVRISGEVNDRQCNGTITKKGDDLKMKFSKFNDDISHLDLALPHKAGETLTHALDDRLF